MKTKNKINKLLEYVCTNIGSENSLKRKKDKVQHLAPQIIWDNISVLCNN